MNRINDFFHSSFYFQVSINRNLFTEKVSGKDPWCSQKGCLAFTERMLGVHGKDAWRFRKGLLSFTERFPEQFNRNGRQLAENNIN